MKEQNFKNHSRLVAGWHGLTFLSIIALLIGSIVNLCNSAPENLYSASLIVLVSVLFVLFFIYARVFALKAQDRAIRAEENLRYFVLTGKRFPSNLRISQTIALRFASDDEFVALAEKAAKDGLSSKEIKQSIQQWRADHHRV